MNLHPPPACDTHLSTTPTRSRACRASPTGSAFFTNFMWELLASCVTSKPCILAQLRLVIAEGKRGLYSCPTRILPFGFRGKSILFARLEFSVLLFGERACLAELCCINPAHIRDRIVPARLNAFASLSWLRSHHLPPLALRHRTDTQLEIPGWKNACRPIAIARHERHERRCERDLNTFHVGGNLR